MGLQARRSWRIPAVLTVLGMVLLQLGWTASLDSSIAAAATEPNVEIAIGAVNPSVVVNAAPNQSVRITAILTNTSGGTLTDLGVRVDRANAVNSAFAVRAMLGDKARGYTPASNTVPIAPKLEKGQRRQLDIELPLMPRPELPSLGIDQPGVYPIALTVTGRPERSGPTPLGSQRMLLPVLSVRGETATTAPIALTGLWPISDRPRVVAGNAGGTTPTLRLTDDSLATQLRDGGRLDVLVSTMRAAIDGEGPRFAGLNQSLCLAIDPELLATVTSMTRGYEVQAADGKVLSGTGADAAVAWLAKMTDLAHRMCSVALPAAQSDLALLTRLTLPDRQRDVVKSGADFVDSTLGVSTRRGIVWPASGAVSSRTAAELRQLHASTLVLADDVVGSYDTPDQPDVVRLPEKGGTASIAAATFDPAAATALALVGDQPQLPAFAFDDEVPEIGWISRGAQLQNALGALSWKALTPTASPRSLFAVPPQQWAPDANEARAVLAQFGNLFDTGLAVPRSLEQLVAQPAHERAFEYRYPNQAAEDEVGLVFGDRIEQLSGRVAALAHAVVDAPNADVTAQDFLDPLRADLVRLTSLAGRQAVAHSTTDPYEGRLLASNDAISHQLAAMEAKVDGYFRAVSVLAPGDVYTLASESSPLLVVARNELPVAVRVLLNIDAPTEMTVSDIGEQQIPPRGSRTLQIPSKVAASRNLVLEASLTTTEGVPFGDPTRISVRSNAYGTALAIITACAATLLVVLSGRRLWHRFMGQPDPADERDEWE